ncbi:zinc finger, C2H2 type, partial [Cooperia oncophora]
MHTTDLYMHCAAAIPVKPAVLAIAKSPDAQTIGSTRRRQMAGICGSMDAVLVNQFQLNVHLMEHDNRRCCPHCLRPFALAQHLLSHVAEEHNEEQPLHCCEMCDESFRFAVQLENHVLKHVAEPKTGSRSAPPSPSESFACQHCSM